MRPILTVEQRLRNIPYPDPSAHVAADIGVEIKFIFFHDAANVGSAVKEEKTCSPLVELVNLGPGFSSLSLPKQISKSCMDQNAYIFT